jgi:CcmD family protein
MDNVPPPETFPYLFGAYTAIWVILAVYLIWLGKRLCKVEAKLAKKGD